MPRQHGKMVSRMRVVVTLCATPAWKKGAEDEGKRIVGYKVKHALLQFNDTTVVPQPPPPSIHHPSIKSSKKHAPPPCISNPPELS